MEFTDDQLERYSRHIVLQDVGGEGQKTLLAAKVLVVGAGGLGSPVLSYLAAAGVGTLGIVDDDVVELSNLQRQIAHRSVDVGAQKVASAAATVEALNPDVKVNRYAARLALENVDQLIADYDIIADGTDNFKTRLLVSDACVRHQKTLVSAALGPFEGQLSTFKPHCDAALPCYRCFVPVDPGGEDGQTCADRGILGAVAGVMGSLQALEVLKEILNIGDSLAGRLLLWDAMTAKQRIVGLPKDENCLACGTKKA